MNEIHTEVPYSKRCEFCGSQVSIATLYADNQVAPTFSVNVCAWCLGNLMYGCTLLDAFGWSWRIDKSQRVTATTTIPPRASDRESNDHPIPTQEVRELVRDLVRALSQHLDPRLNPLSDDIRGRDETLLFRAMNYLGGFTEKGVPDGER